MPLRNGDRRTKSLGPAIFRVGLVVGDLGFYHLGMALAVWLRFPAGIPARNLDAWLKLAPWASVAVVALFALYELYGSSRRPWQDCLASLVVAVGLSTAALAAFSYLVGAAAFPRSVVPLSWVFQTVLMALWRWLMWRLDLSVHPPCRLLVVGPPAETERFSTRVAADQALGFEVVGRCNSVDEVAGLLAAVDAVVACPSLAIKEKIQLAEQAHQKGIQTLVVPGVYEALVQGAHVLAVDDLPLFSLCAAPTFGVEVARRARDTALSALALVVAAPLMILVALAIKLSQPSAPVLYRQSRLGLRGTPFTLLKFRTMGPQAEKGTGPVLATAGDPRVTPLGRVLRRTHLDELPQLINVVKGEMSFVGPRPERPVMVRNHMEAIPGYGCRLVVAPGLTGPAQVAGRYDTPPEDKLIHELLYLSSRTWIQDLLLFLRTLAAAITPRRSR